MEWERCDALRETELVAGQKIEFEKAEVREGVILMTNKTVKYLGGYVKTVEENWRAKRDAKVKSKWRAWMDREGKGPPAFRPFSKKHLNRAREEKSKRTKQGKQTKEDDKKVNMKLRELSISARDQATELIRKDRDLRQNEKKKEVVLPQPTKKKKKKKSNPPKNQTTTMIDKTTEQPPRLLSHGFAELSNSEGLVEAYIRDIKLLDLHTACVEPQLRLCLEDTSARRRKIEATCSNTLRNMLLSIRSPETALEVKQSVHGRKRIQARCESLRVALSRAPPQYFDMRRTNADRGSRDDIKREPETKYTIWTVTSAPQ